jgi:hypothetical protein
MRRDHGDHDAAHESVQLHAEQAEDVGKELHPPALGQEHQEVARHVEKLVVVTQPRDDRVALGVGENRVGHHVGEPVEELVVHQRALAGDALGHADVARGGLHHGPGIA